MQALADIIAKNGFALADGATGTNYFNLGLEAGYPPELWAVEKPEVVGGLHRQFLEAGSDIILTNSFGGTSHRLKLHNAQARVGELNQAAAQVARQEAKRAMDRRPTPVIVAGSMGPTGELFTPLGSLTEAEARQAFGDQAAALAEGGVDMLWIETISAFDESFAAIEAAKTTGLPVAATMTFDTAGKSMMGVSPADFATTIASRGVVALGANCGVGPAELIESVLAMKPQASKQDNIWRIAKGNCGIPGFIDGEIHYHGTPELMASYACIARDAGVAIIGGCCGTTPAHVKAMRQALDTQPAQPVTAARLLETLGAAWQKADGEAGGDKKAHAATQARRQRRRRRGG